MRVTVGDLVRIPHLRLDLFAGGGGLDRPVSWAHASDLDSVRDWLAGGELLIRNGRTLPPLGADQAELLRNLADVGASGLVVGEDPQTPALCDELAAAAEDCGIPLLVAPYSVGFAAISRAVADANSRDDAARVGQVERVYAAVRDALGGVPAESPVARLSRELGCRLLLLDAASAHPVDPSAPEPPPELRAAVRAAVRACEGKIPGVLRLPSADSGTSLAVEVPAEEPTLLVVEGLPSASSDTSLLHHLATVAAVEVARHAMALEHQRRVHGELLAHLLDARTDAPTARHELEAAGLEPSACVLVAAQHGDEPGRRDLHLTLGRRRIPHLLLSREPLLLALLPDDPDVLMTVRNKLGPAVLLGVGNALGVPDRLPTAHKEAMWALNLAATSEDRIARYGDDSAHTVLRSIDEARVVVDRVLGPLLAYDAAHRTDLVGSLDAFLHCRRSWQRTAAALNVHKQTVMYRMQRVEQLTGRTLATTGDLAELWIALQARELLGGPARTEGPGSHFRGAFRGASI
ncbi:PucR family transcriptional regulator ligand-binding domain-containing protein [Streptomyces sp. MCA2]|uniref:PucR family transcriptional regulator n=1 Tax=Streptomyces sp. MCA2 TaxID=2944805 RepID=UPI0020216BEF|nr:PucR family transcriptional regulator [Streptomyces sp. MCA2]MCL7497153.1 PucR family transcriptional regulator ligand-binding domain-containing protein [Streptomyces sp. MCA2]